MILLAMSLLVTAQTAETPPPDDVVVAAERLKRFRAIIRKDRRSGENRCVVKRPSGDPALDRGVCDAMLSCAPKVTRPSDIRPCMEPAMKALLPNHTWRAGRAGHLD